MTQKKTTYGEGRSRRTSKPNMLKALNRIQSEVISLIGSAPLYGHPQKRFDYVKADLMKMTEEVALLWDPLARLRDPQDPNRQVDELVDFFNTEAGRAMASNGDAGNMSPAQCAIHYLKDYVRLQKVRYLDPRVIAPNVDFTHISDKDRFKEDVTREVKTALLAQMTDPTTEFGHKILNLLRDRLTFR